MFKIIFLISLSLSKFSIVSAQEVVEASLADQGYALLKQNKFADAIKIYDRAISEAGESSADEMIKKRKLLASKGWALARLKKGEESKKLMNQRYEMIAAATKKYPDNIEIAKLQIKDLGALARLHDLRKESAKRFDLELQAVALTNALSAKYPEDQGVLLTRYNAQFRLAETCRWNKELRSKVKALVNQGLETLDKIDPKSLPADLTKVYLKLKLVNLDISVLSLNKEYVKSHKLSADLLDETKVIIFDEKVKPYQISLLSSVMYHYAFLHEKLGKPKEAQFHLENLLKIYKVSLVKFPNDPTLLGGQKRYREWLGKTLK